VHQTYKSRGWLLLAAMICGLAACEVPSTNSIDSGRVLYLEQLNQDEVDALDRERTIFFLSFGNLEEHGPHLPVGSDYYRAIEIRNRLTEQLRVAYPDYAFVLFPVVPLGEGGANDLAHQPDHIGTYSIRYQTLRDIAIDLGSTVARKGFQHIFVIEAHGAQLHNVALNQASDFVSNRYKVGMVNITSRSKTFDGATEVMDRYLGEGWIERSGFPGHAGASETSEVLATAGGKYVERTYRKLEPFYVDGFAGFVRTYEKEGWRGYWGDPARASVEMGDELLDQRVARAYEVAVAALSGKDLSDTPPYPDHDPSIIRESESAWRAQLQRYAEYRSEIDAWLEQNPWPPTTQ